MKPRTTCKIEGKVVGRRAFDRFLAGLTRTRGWYCDETSTGGVTGWNARDAAGAAFAF